MGNIDVWKYQLTDSQLFYHGYIRPRRSELGNKYTLFANFALIRRVLSTNIYQGGCYESKQFKTSPTRE